MKRLLTIMLAVMMAATTMRAGDTSRIHGDEWESHRSTLSFTAGYMSLFYFGASSLSWIPALSSNGAKDIKYYGGFGIHYHHQNFWWLRSGFKMNWEGSSFSMVDAPTTNPKGTSFVHMAALMGSVEFTYINLKYFQMYAGIDLGLGVYVRDDRYSGEYADSKGNKHPISYAFLPALNITVLGLSAGGEHVFGLLEAGVGMETLIKAGIGFRF